MGTQIFIRSAQTKWYLADGNQWSVDSARARCFPSAFEADNYCRENQLTGVEIMIVRVDRPVLVIPVRVRQAATARGSNGQESDTSA